jgi:hypothetical protein
VHASCIAKNICCVCECCQGSGHAVALGLPPSPHMQALNGMFGVFRGRVAHVNKATLAGSSAAWYSSPTHPLMSRAVCVTPRPLAVNSYASLPSWTTAPFAQWGSCTDAQAR